MFRLADMTRLGIPGILTEFDVGMGRNPTVGQLDKLKMFVRLAKMKNQSWITWGYKSFYNKTGDFDGFYDSEGNLTDGAKLLVK